MKSIGPIAIALIGCLIFLLFEGFIFNVFIGTNIYIKTIAKEISIIEGVNKLENVKISLPYTLYYSYKTTLKNMGYKNYGEIDNKESFLSNFSKTFSLYKNELEKKTNVSISNYEIEIEEDESVIKIVLHSPRYILYESHSKELKFRIYDILNTTILISPTNNTLLGVY
ncbi:MAG: hypothetical protein QXD89_01075 [Candidatus Aenigmatarchaeota archaeon]